MKNFRVNECHEIVELLNSAVEKIEVLESDVQTLSGELNRERSEKERFQRLYEELYNKVNNIEYQQNNRMQSLTSQLEKLERLKIDK